MNPRNKIISGNGLGRQMDLELARRVLMIPGVSQKAIKAAKLIQEQPSYPTQSMHILTRTYEKWMEQKLRKEAL